MAPRTVCGCQVLASLRPAEPTSSGAEIIHLEFAPPATAEPAWSRERPFPAEVLEHINLNSSRSDKVTVHLGLSLAGAGLAFGPGGALMLVPENDPAMVDQLLAASAVIADEARCRTAPWPSPPGGLSTAGLPTRPRAQVP